MTDHRIQAQTPPPNYDPTDSTSHLQRWSIFAASASVGLFACASVAWTVVPSNYSLLQRMGIWTVMVFGPTWFTYKAAPQWWLAPLQIGLFEVVIVLGWIGLFLTFAHPIGPRPAKAFLTALGFLLWYGSGIFVMINAIWSV